MEPPPVSVMDTQRDVTRGRVCVWIVETGRKEINVIGAGQDSTDTQEEAVNSVLVRTLIRQTSEFDSGIIH